jgi:casein kinase II subunit beta
VLPCGRADIPGLDTVKLYCPNCGDIYSPPSSKYASVDGAPFPFSSALEPADNLGAFFGTTFAPLFFQTYPELLSVPFYAPSPPSRSASRPISPSPSPTPVGGETLINPNPHGGQKPALGKVYTPRIYGFKVSERARNGPRMKWLRERPERWEELDEVDWKGKFKGAEGAGTGDDDKMVVEDKEKPSAGGSGSGKGRLFDEDEEEEDDEEEEEEEEVQVKPDTMDMKASTAVPATAAAVGTGSSSKGKGSSGSGKGTTVVR